MYRFDDQNENLSAMEATDSHTLVCVQELRSGPK